MPTIDNLKKAIVVAQQIEKHQSQLAKLQAELQSLLQKGSAPVTAAKVAIPSVVKPAKRKGGLSAAGRAAIVAAQKARWAKVKKGKAGKAAAKKAAPAKPAKKKRNISPEGRKKLAEMMKARWAAKKAAKGKK
jgi:hypothetical protein